jgi:hypothetical protein
MAVADRRFPARTGGPRPSLAGWMFHSYRNPRMKIARPATFKVPSRWLFARTDTNAGIGMAER